MNPEQELREYDNSQSWNAVYQRFRNEASLKHDFNCDASKLSINKNRNRYRDVSPYDHSRIILKRNNVDYINANLVKFDRANRQYILTQGPLPITAGHFWLMVWEQNSKAVLMLNRVVENDQIKCYQYFPTSNMEGDDRMVFNEVSLSVTFVSEQYADFYTVRTLRITDLETDESKEVFQFHYTKWPDFGVPSSPEDFLKFLIAVRESGALTLSETVGPPIIHCSAGIGRSGTFCLVDTCLVLIEQTKSFDSVDVKHILMDMRSYRVGLIQTAHQLRFSYLAIVEGASSILGIATDEVIPNHNPPPPPFERNTIPSFPAYADDSSEESDEDDSSDDEDSCPTEPAPLPPSLDNLKKHEKGVKRPFGCVDGEEAPPLPPRGPRPFVEDLEESYCSPTNNREVECNANSVTLNSDKTLRQRLRSDRKTRLSKTVENMKKKQRQHEWWQSKKAKWTPYVAGVMSFVVLGSSYLYYKYYMT